MQIKHYGMQHGERGKDEAIILCQIGQSEYAPNKINMPYKHRFMFSHIVVAESTRYTYCKAVLANSLMVPLTDWSARPCPDEFQIQWIRKLQIFLKIGT